MNAPGPVERCVCQLEPGSPEAKRFCPQASGCCSIGEDAGLLIPALRRLLFYLFIFLVGVLVFMTPLICL